MVWAWRASGVGVEGWWCGHGWGGVGRPPSGWWSAWAWRAGGPRCPILHLSDATHCPPPSLHRRGLLPPLRPLPLRQENPYPPPPAVTPSTCRASHPPPRSLPPAGASSPGGGCGRLPPTWPPSPTNTTNVIHVGSNKPYTGGELDSHR